MDVCASFGTKIGKVDHVQGDKIKLTKNDSPDGKHHTIPLFWMAKPAPVPPENPPAAPPALQG